MHYKIEFHQICLFFCSKIYIIRFIGGTFFCFSFSFLNYIHLYHYCLFLFPQTVMVSEIVGLSFCMPVQASDTYYVPLRSVEQLIPFTKAECWLSRVEPFSGVEMHMEMDMDWKWMEMGHNL